MAEGKRIPEIKITLYTIAALAVVLAPLALTGCEQARAADSCLGIATRDVRAVEDDAAIWKKGTKDTITGLTDDGKTFFQHGGFEYPSSAIKLVNCKAVHGHFQGGARWKLVLDPNKNSAFTITFDELDDSLIQAGLCMACAGNVANAYASGHMAASCKRLVDDAIGGDANAVEKLNNTSTEGFGNRGCGKRFGACIG